MCRTEKGVLIFEHLPDDRESRSIAGMHSLFGDPLGIERHLNRTSGLVNGETDRGHGPFGG